MLKHKISSKRTRLYSHGSDTSYEDIVNEQKQSQSPISPPGSVSSLSIVAAVGGSLPTPVSGLSNIGFSGSTASTGITTTTSTVTAATPSSTSSGQQYTYNQHQSSNESVAGCTTPFPCSDIYIGAVASSSSSSTNSIEKQQNVCLSRRRPPAGGGNSVDIMRRWNSFHSTRGECHPNRFRRNRKSTSPSIESSCLKKLSASTGLSCATGGESGSGSSASFRANSPNNSCNSGINSILDNSTILKYGRHSVNDDPQLLTRGWQLRRGKSLAEGTNNNNSRSQSLISPNPSHCFGNRNGRSIRRPSECFVFETSEMIVIGYPEVTQSSNTINFLHHHIPPPLRNSQCSNAGANSSCCGVGTGIISYQDVNASGGNSTNDSLNSDHSGGDTPNSAASDYNLGISIPTTLSASASGLIASSSQPSHHHHSSSDSRSSSGILSGNSNTNSNSYHHHRNSTPDSLTCLGGIKSTTNVGGSIPVNYRQLASSNGGNNCSSITTATGTSTIMDHHHIRHSTGFSSNRPELYQKCNRSSHSSDTSSAYSGSDTMTSVHSSSLDAEEVDLSGLVESVVDSDEEDLAESMDSLNVRDAVRDCLEKDPSDRTEDDIETLLDFTQTLKAFTNMTLAVRRALCSVMVFAVVDKAGIMVMNDGEELDSWSVLINGHVEIEHSNGDREELQVGDSFGILPTMDKLYHRGVMRTKCDDCQFVCITQTDYYRIQHQGEENTKRHEIDGNVVMVTELRHTGSETGTTPLRRGHVVIRGTPDRLLLQLIEENSMTDPTYVEDFLLTHRTFINNSQKVAIQLLQWFENENTLPYQTIATPSEIRDRVTRVILLWVNNHFTDFETYTEMMELLETFEIGLEKKNMFDQLRLLHIACAAKARTRNVTLARSSRDENLHFNIIGGYERGGYGIFILQVHKNTKADAVGLKRGDQILEVNGQSFDHVTYKRAMELLMGSTHLSITVKSNLLSFKEMLQNSDNQSPRPRPQPNRRRICCPNDIVSNLSSASAGPFTTDSTLRAQARLSTTVDLLVRDQVDCCSSPTRDLNNTFVTSGSNVGGCSSANKKDLGHLSSSSNISNSSTITTSSSSSSSSSLSLKGGFMTLGPKRRIQKALIKMNLLPKNTALDSDDDHGHQQLHQLASIVNQSNNLTTGTIPTSTGQNYLSSTCNITNNNNNSTNSNNNNITRNVNSSNQQQSQLYHSHSNPDLTTIYYEDTRTPDYPEHVLKVYKSDQTCKYLLINKETTAHEVVMLALQEFGIHETSSNFSLCEVSVGDGGMIKQRRLPDQLQNLAERIGLCSRYYLKTNGITETLVPDDMAPDLIRESTVHFLQLNANEVAIQLTFQDFAIFRQIESTEYVDDLFELKSKYGVPMIKQFAELVNREMFWVVTEVCSEHNMVRRMKIVKQFIKIARHCKECRNFNSMFAIISGLGHAAVFRLRQTWEKLPTKYQKLFADLQDLMDPSRNMSKYRQLVSAELLVQHPIIPFYPVVKKDLTFIHLGNDTRVENLINFEKLRMIAKEVRILTHMCSSTYDLLTMLEFKGQAPSSAMVALNQMSVSTGTHNHGQATVKRRKKSTAAPNPKKMFEEAQMVRRVKAYLNNMKVITDEDVLHSLSLECEPSGSGNSSGGGAGGSSGSGGGSAPNSVTIRKRHPSPTLSTTSSTSSTSEGKKGGIVGPKFGTASPQAVKKILSLSETTKTRPHQPRHPCIGLPLVGHPHTLHHPLHHSSISPSPSPGAHRRMGSSSSAGSVSYSTHNFAHPANGTSRAVHERSHSDTPAPLPSVDLSAESSSVTSLSNLPLRKTITSGSVTSSDSGHGSCVQADTHSNCSEATSGLYHVASSIVHNSPSPTLQQRRHSAIHGHALMAPPPPKGPRHPPAYSVAAQMARLHRLGRAHSHEGVTSTIIGSGGSGGYYHPEPGEEDDDEDAQVSAV